VSMRFHPLALTAVLIALSTLAAFAAVGPGQQAVLDHYAAAAKASDPGFAGFSADRGRAFFLATNYVNALAPSCSTCHTTDPRQVGQTTAGKSIAPMAVSVTPDRFTDLAKVEKWFGRNCRTVLGRECTDREKGDYITYLANQ
jgi:Domain of unknown function (DUF1924)